MPDAWSGSYYDMKTVWPTSERVRVFDLAHALHVGAPRHLNHPPYLFSLTKQHGEVSFADGVSAAAELITTGGHSGTHVDATGHVSQHGKVFGGRPIEDAQSYAGGLEVGSIEETPPFIGPGHLIDAPRLLGRDLSPDDCIGPAELEQWFADREEPHEGSIVLLRTGWAQYWNDPVRYQGRETGLPGVTGDGAHWLSERDVTAVGSDTLVLEKMSYPDDLRRPVHVHLLVDRGIFIMEALNLEVLAEHEVTDFTFIALPLRIRGGTGSLIRPIAITERDTTP